MTETLTNPLPPPGPRPDRFAPQGPGDESTAGSGRGGVPLLTAFLSLLVVGTDLFVVSPLLPAIADDYGVSAGAAGASVTAFSLAYMLAAPAVGTWRTGSAGGPCSWSRSAGSRRRTRSPVSPRRSRC